MYRVFAQATQPRVDLAGVVRNAARFFEASVEVLAETLDGPDGAPVRSTARLRLESARHGYRGSFGVTARPRSDADLLEARDAEVRGRAAGMASLAERCRFVWEVAPEGDVPEAALLHLCGLLASVALGPVLPPDGSTLYGVLGAMERVERLLSVN